MKIFLILLCLCGLLHAEPVPITEINEEHIGKTVEIRGFLYRDNNNQLFLAAEPNLKSCCVGKKQQILVAGAFLEPQNHVIELTGQLHLLKNRFVLNDPKKIQRPPKNNLAAYLVVFGVFGCILYVRRQKTRNRDNDR